MPLEANRRRFLHFLASSPLLAAQDGGLTDAKDALNVWDFEAAARRVLPPAHFGYIQTGVEGDATLRANVEAFQRIQLRPRRLAGVTKADLRIQVFGVSWETPIYFNPCGNQKGFHPLGEIATARAAGTRKILPVISTVTTSPLPQITKEAGQPVWYQLYATDRWAVTEQLVRRAEAAGCPVLALTVDLNAGRSTETLERAKRLDTRPCQTCHSNEPGARYRRMPMFEGIDMSDVSLFYPAMDWTFVDRLRKLTSMKLVIKGIVTGPDAKLAVEHGADGIVVSNHGGRAEESGRATIECLPEVLDGSAGKVPVLLDGGIRRGSDVFKALALGATAVGVGRPYLWGLGSFGQAGVERVVDILLAELELTMKQCGTASVAAIQKPYVLIR